MNPPLPVKTAMNKKTTMGAEEVKEAAQVLGADLCGIAPAYRFDEAPAGFRPSDIFPRTAAVVVLAKRIPEGAFAATSPVPYTIASEMTLQEVHRLTCALALQLQDAGITAVPIPSEPYEYWDAEAMVGKGILSLRHAGYMAGLGVFGKNKLITNDVYGNRITLGALLVDAPLEGDLIAGYAFCSGSMCSLCLQNCPVGALDGVTTDQKKCRGHAEVRTAKGYVLFACHICRTICPKGRGMSRGSRNIAAKGHGSSPVLVLGQRSEVLIDPQHSAEAPSIATRRARRRTRGRPSG